MTTSYFRRRIRETLGQITRDKKGRFVKVAEVSAPGLIHRRFIV